MSVQILDNLEDLEDVETAEEAEDADKQPEPQGQPAPVFDAAAEARLREGIINDLLRIAAPGASASQKSNLEATLEDLLAQGINPDALRNFMRLSEAQRKDQAAALQAEQAQRNQDQFDALLWQHAINAFDGLAQHIPILANAGKGMRQDLLTQVALVINSDSDFASEKAQIRSGEVPAKGKFEKAAAKVIDKWCAENNVTKPTKSLSIKNSKPQDAVSGKLDINSLPKGARQLYEATLKYTGDPKKAEARARQALAE